MQGLPQLAGKRSGERQSDAEDHGQRQPEAVVQQLRTGCILMESEPGRSLRPPAGEFPVFRDLRQLNSLLRRINSLFRLRREFSRKVLESRLFF
jgi:hypothetical protein